MVIKNDLHVHSVQSFCGFHTVWEIARIAVNKGMSRVNISDHGSGLKRAMNFGVIVDKRRLPDPVTLPDGSSMHILRGIEANIMDVEGTTDIPPPLIPKFDLISLGFHFCGLPQNGEESDNTRALEQAVCNNPVDLLTHPCIATYPLHLPTVFDLAQEYGFALEINNTNLRVDKTDCRRLERMIETARERNIHLVETSDGHTYAEIGENEQIEALLERMGLNGDTFLLNRHEERLVSFLEARKKRRQ